MAIIPTLLSLSEQAEQLGEVPVGAIVAHNGNIISQAYNQVESTNDPTMHAEMIAIREASKKLSNHRLVGCDLYTTLEPCIMCAGAIIHARISTVYFLAYDHKWGAFGSVYQLHTDNKLNHVVTVVKLDDGGGSEMALKKFFQRLR
jgi:tRNA(adenine34) deaminase